MNKWDLFYKKNIKYKMLNNLFLDTILTKINKFNKLKNKSVIDLGCGSGDSLLKFSKKKFVLTGVDSSAVAISQSKKIFEKEKINIKLITSDLEDFLKNNQEQFDIIFCKDTYAFIKNKENFLKQIKKMMKKNSAFILITPVNYKNISYTINDKLGITVKFEKNYKLLLKIFKKVTIFHHNYFSDNGDIVTFLITLK